MKIFRTLIQFLFGIGLGGGKSSPVETVARVVDEYKYTTQERMETDQVDLASARAMSFSYNDLVDKFNRLIRPWLSVHIGGGVLGLWKLPSIDAIPPFWQNVFLIILTFWFGGRAILVDLPKAVRAIRGL